MCIMEVRKGQESATIAQAMAHNTSTVERDMDMFELLLEARGQFAELTVVREAHDELRVAYAKLLHVFGVEVARDVQHGHDHDNAHGHVHADDYGNERPPAELVEAAALAGDHYAQEARKYMTR